MDIKGNFPKRQKDIPFVAQGEGLWDHHLSLKCIPLSECWNIMCDPRRKDSMYIQVWLVVSKGSIILCSDSYIQSEWKQQTGRLIPSFLLKILCYFYKSQIQSISFHCSLTSCSLFKSKTLTHFFLLYEHFKVKWINFKFHFICLWRSEEVIKFSGTRVTATSAEKKEKNSHPLQKQQVLLIIEPSFLPFSSL